MGRSVARLVAASALATAASLGSATAQTSSEGAERSPVVVELFTSQGCSSCPPADQLLRDLAQEEGVIALALHVDYWDYIGWKDSFARPEHTVRQKAYARASGERMIYTPQIIVEGRARVVGAKAMAVVNAVEEQRAAPPQIALTAERTGEVLQIEARALTQATAELVVQLVRYKPEGRVEILRGENAGRTLSYANIVTAWDVVAEWTVDTPLSLRLDVPGDQPAVVIVQETGHGPILAAAELR
ncbi:MAG: DUF1223 domain-containing protein [Pseudomonadota bacterium]